MAYDESKLLTSKRMINLLRVALGGCIEDSSPDISATPADIEINGNVTNVFSGSGLRLSAFNGSVTPIEVDLSGSSAAGKIIKDGTYGVLLITWDGSAMDAVLCENNKKTSRASVESALATSNNANIAPRSLDLSDKCVIAYAKVLNETGSDFVIGTTSLATANITDTYVAVRNVMPGVEVI